jgi:Acetyltransferase (GNAT) domain
MARIALLVAPFCHRRVRCRSAAGVRGATTVSQAQERISNVLRFATDFERRAPRTEAASSRGFSRPLCSSPRPAHLGTTSGARSIQRRGFQEVFSRVPGIRRRLDRIGSSRFHGHDPEKREVEIGWTFLARSHWGGIYNKEMKQLMLRHAFRFVNRVIFLVGPQNFRSQRAVEKIGGVRVGSRPDGGGRDSFIYEITPSIFALC